MAVPQGRKKAAMVSSRTGTPTIQKPMQGLCSCCKGPSRICLLEHSSMQTFGPCPKTLTHLLHVGQGAQSACMEDLLPLSGLDHFKENSTGANTRRLKALPQPSIIISACRYVSALIVLPCHATHSAHGLGRLQAGAPQTTISC
jgi:hypothetical protein